MSIVYLNGSFLPEDEAKVSVNDRGFLFGDGIYEVTPCYDGELFLLDRHIARFRRGLGAVRIDYEALDFEAIHQRLFRENGLTTGMAYVYLQVTRGVAKRSHAFPSPPVAPTVYAFASGFQRPSQERWQEGFDAVTVPERRWSRVDIKSIALLPNCLAQQAAVEAGAADALFVREGVAIEGSHNNFFAVFGDTVVTYPATQHILHGITREFVIELCHELGISVELRPVMVEELLAADEAFFTGTTTEVRPTVRIDGRTVGSGRAGPITTRLSEAFRAHVDRGSPEVRPSA